MNSIYLKRGYKYQLERSYKHSLAELKDYQATLPDGWVSLFPNGNLFIRKGYAWDGPSGPTIDTPSFQRGALVHDALYQLLRAGALPSSCRLLADRELRRVCRADGMARVRAEYVYWSVRLFAGSAARPGKHRRVEVYPQNAPRCP